MLPNSDSEGKDSVDLILDSLFSIQVEQPWRLLQFGNSNVEEIGADRVVALVSASPEDEDGKTREEVVKDVYKRQFKHLSEDCQEYYFDFEAYASHLQEHGKFLVTEHGIFELPE